MDVGFPLAGENALSLFVKNEKGSGGFFPIGTNRYWHGGMHFNIAKPVLAIADGTLVAYRFNKEPLKCVIDGKAASYSSGFVLLSHELQGADGFKVRFYSLYMHLLPLSGYTGVLKDEAPAFLPRKYTTLMNLSVHEEANQKSKAPRTLAKGSTVLFKNPKSLRTGYQELADGGFAYFAEKYIATSVDIPQDNKVVLPDPQVMFKCGDIVGQPGPYMGANNVLHLEVFTDSVDFMTNPKKISRGPKTLKVARGATFKTKEPDFDRVAVPLTPGSRVKPIPGDSASKAINVECIDTVGWVPRSILGDFDKKSNTYKLAQDLSTVYIADPGAGKSEPPTATVDARKGDVVRLLKLNKEHRQIRVSQKEKKHGWALTADLKKISSTEYLVKNTVLELASQNPEKSFKFEKDAGQNADDLLVKESAAQTASVTTVKGEKWYEIEYEINKKGWIKSDDPKITVLSEYDWPGWVRIQEPDKYSKKGLCDVAALLDLVNGKSSGKISDLKTALQDAQLATHLRLLACLHPSEWDAKSDKASDKWTPLKGPPWNMTDDAYKQTLAYIEALQWWSSIDSKSLPTDAAKVWHLHPIGFIEQLRRLSVPLTFADKKKIIQFVSGREAKSFSECNYDREFKGDFPIDVVSYAGVLHIGLSWGFIQFTQDSGNLGVVLETLKGKDEKLFADAFGNNWKEMLEVVQAKGESGMEQWGKAGNPSAGSDVPEIRGPRVQPVAVDVNDDGEKGEKQDLWEGVWLERFKNAGTVYSNAGKKKDFEDAQWEVAFALFLKPALEVCKKINIRSSKGIATAFDRTVQGWSRSLWKAWTKRTPIQTTNEEMEFLEKSRDGTVGDINLRLSRILASTELRETSYDVESY